MGTIFRAISIVAVLLTGALSADTVAQPDQDWLREIEEFQDRRQLIDELEAPTPEGRVGGLREGFENPERVFSKDLVTGELSSRMPRDAQDAERPLRSPEFSGSYHQLSKLPDYNNQRGSPTPPVPFRYPYSFPWTSHYKLRMTFPDGSGSVCSASSVGSFHLVTAGHCIYAHDKGGWAESAKAYGAATDVLAPLGFFDYPFGEARVLTMHTYNGWINNRDFNHDFAILRVNWRVGSRTGWMGRETNVTAQSLNYNGYPVEGPYIPSSDRRFQHPDFEDTSGYNTYRIAMKAYTYGGHSGGPVWRFDDDRYLQGVNSTSNREGDAYATRLTNAKFTDIDEIMDADEADSPPVDRPELVEYGLGADYKSVYPDEVAPGGDIDIGWNVSNIGLASSGEVSVYIYLSTFPWFDSQYSQLIYSTTIPDGVSPNSYWYSVDQVTIPDDTPTGNFYVHWLFYPEHFEYNSSDNVGLVSDQPILVDPNACPPDPGESDGLGSGTLLTGTNTVSRSICPASDVDWFELGLTEPSNAVTVWTWGDGAAGDTELRLRDTSGAIVAESSGSSGGFDYLSLDCQGSIQPPERMVEISSGDGQRIESYSISAEIQPCPHSSDIELFADVTETGSVEASRPAGDWSFYYFDSGSEAVEVSIRLHDLTADADLYVRVEEKPTARTYLCRPYNGSSTEEVCRFILQSNERAYVGVANWDSGPINFSVTASVRDGEIFLDRFQ